MLSIISSRIIALSLLIVSGQDALAQDYDKGLAHRHNGEFQEAYVQFLELAEQGDAGAQFNLGQMYAGGEGGPKDYKARAWAYPRVVAGHVGWHVQKRPRRQKKQPICLHVVSYCNFSGGNVCKG